MPAALQMEDLPVSITQELAYSEPDQAPEAKRLAVFIPSLAAGGVARVVLRLAGTLTEHGYRVDLVLCRAEGAFAHEIPAKVRMVELQGESGWRFRMHALTVDWGGLGAILLPVLMALRPAPPYPYIGDLARYIRTERPDVVLTAKTHTNAVALWARRLAGVPTKVVISEHTHLSKDLQSHIRKKWRWRYVVPLIRRVYPWADAIIAVSDGVADDLSKTAAIPRDLITTVHNPIVTGDLLEKAAAELEHPWFRPGAPPVVLGVGRLVPPKDFPTLLRAFAKLRSKRDARLMILGEGKNQKPRTELLKLAEELNISDALALPGFVENPFAYMARASVFVLSSAWEGFGNVLAEALACGCPVVSTDCDSGPAEILEGGAYGRLAPVGDHEALAEAIIATLDDPPDRERLRRRGAEFSVERAAHRYLEVLLDKV